MMPRPTAITRFIFGQPPSPSGCLHGGRGQQEMTAIRLDRRGPSCIP
jgi:hypothetical protein